MSYLLVEWRNEDKTYSVVKRNCLADGELRLTTQELVGKEVSVTWGKGTYPAKVLNVGDCEAALDKMADNLAEQAFLDNSETLPAVGTSTNQATKRGRKRKTDSNQAAKISSLLAVADSNHSTVDITTCTAPPVYEDVDLSAVPLTTSTEHKYKDKYKRLKLKYKDLKSRLKAVETELASRDEQLNVELLEGSGVYIPRHELESMKLVSKEKTFLARNLFRRLFTSEELCGHSLFGKKCNANKEKLPLPEIDVVRRNAIISFVLKEYGYLTDCSDRDAKQRIKTAKRELHKSLSDFLREEQARNKAK